MYSPFRILIDYCQKVSSMGRDDEVIAATEAYFLDNDANRFK